MLLYITSNSDKIFIAKSRLKDYGISFEAKAVDMVEIQSTSTEEIAQHKAKQAFEMLRTPLFVTDDGWSIPALNGFPGPYMKYMNDWLTPTDFLNLMKDHTDKRIIHTVTLCYTDGENSRTFTTSYQGHFMDSIQGNGFAAMRVVSMTPDGKSVASYLEEKKNPVPNNELWKEFANWYKSISK